MNATVRPPGSPPPPPSAALLRRLAPLGALYRRVFSARVAGLERVPAGPALLVGNHNGGLVSPETVLLVTAWNDHARYRDPLALLGHDVLFRTPLVAQVARRVGGIPAHPEGASAVLAAGRKALVFPGGDHEAFRPSADRDLIDFAGRRGFVRLALRCGVPVVPVVTAGAHDVFRVLCRGDRLARWLHLDRWLRAKVVPVSFALPFGFTLGPPTPFLPLPCQVRMEVLEPIELAGDPDDPAAWAAGYRQVTALMQRGLTRLTRGLPGRPD